MMEQLLLEDLGLVLVAGTAVAILAKLIRVPSIVAFILAGLLLGPVFGLVEMSHTMELIAEVGIILLLFLVGLELSLKKIKDIGGVALGAGLSQMAITGAAVAGIAWAFGMSGGDILFLGVALTFSSTVVVVKLLDQLRALDARHGRIAVGILLVQDLVVVIVLTFVAGLSGGQELETLDMIRDLGLAFAGMGLLLAAASFATWKLLPRMFDWIAPSQSALITWSLAWCFLLVLASYLMNLSVELGAFIAGVALAQLPYNHDLRRRVRPLMNFFVAVFFVTLGVQMELGAAVAAWPLVTALVLFTLLLKPPLIAWLARGLEEPPRVALRSGLTLGQTSEFSFILAALALSNELIDQTLLSIVGAVGLLTMGLSSFSIIRGNRLVDWFESKGLVPIFTGGQPQGVALGGTSGGASPEGGDEEEDEEASGLRDHVIVVGMNSLGRRIVEILHEKGESVLAIDTDPAKLRGLPCRTLFGNAEYQSVLDESKFERAKLVVSALHIEDVNRLLAYRAGRQGIPSMIHAYEAAVEGELEAIEGAHLLNSRAAGVDLMIEELQEEGLFGR